MWYYICFIDVGECFVCLYGVVVVCCVSEGYLLVDFSVEDVVQNVCDVVCELMGELQWLVGKFLLFVEEEWLCVYIVVCQVQDVDLEIISVDDDEVLVNYILCYINSQYNYNLLDDVQLYVDLLIYIKIMIIWVCYQIMIFNLLLDNIKQYYLMVWDMILVVVFSWGKYILYIISENEIGFLVLYIGVGLECYYNIGYQCQLQVLLVCDISNVMVWMIEVILQCKYLQLEIVVIIFQCEYEQWDVIEVDFVILMVWIGEKDKLVVIIVLFFIDYQLD